MLLGNTINTQAYSSQYFYREYNLHGFFLMIFFKNIFIFEKHFPLYLFIFNFLFIYFNHHGGEILVIWLVERKAIKLLIWYVAREKQIRY